MRDRLRRLGDRLEVRLRKAIRAEFRRVAANPRDNNHEARILYILSDHYRITADRHLPLIKKMLQTRRSDETAFDVPFVVRVQEWIAQHATRRASQISGQTRQLITVALQEAAAEGLGEVDAAEKIQKAVSGQIGLRRANTIARTETGAAQNAAIDLGGEVSGVEIIREWVSVDDARTRPTHASADGQTRKPGEAFDVGGVRLDRPGDPNGPAKEIINCRCTVILEPIIPE